MWRVVFTAIVVFVGGALCAYGGQGDGAINSTYVFEVDQSTVIATGGIWGAYEVYSVEGWFELTLGPAEGAASFSLVDAKVIGEGGILISGCSLGDLFNMTELTGTVLNESTIEFDGPAGWGDCTVELNLMYQGDSVLLTGETIPPPGSADYFYFILDAVAHQVPGNYCGGHGTADDPYLICDANQLNQIAIHDQDWDSHFKLLADLDLSVLEHSSFPIGRTWDMPFSGVFDGDGHTVSNFRLDRVESEQDNTGLFGVVRGSGSAVKNLGVVDPNVRGPYCVGALAGLLAEGAVTNCYVVGGDVYGDDENAGGLIGDVCCGGTVAQCYAATTVLGDEAIGGLVGKATRSMITDCYARGSVTGNDEVGGLVGVSFENTHIYRCWATGAIVVNGDAAGGLVGENSYGASVSQSYALGSVWADGRVGGLVGANMVGAAIIQCYSAGAVSGEGAMVGGLVGFNYDSEVAGGYWDRETSGMAIMCGSETGGGSGCCDANGKTTAEMMRQSTFPDWDFINVWGIGENQTYPYLRVYRAGDINHDGAVNFLDVAILGEQWMDNGN